MKAKPADIEMYLKLLEETPRRIRALPKEIDDTRLRFRPNNKTWSANDILAHLRSCADVWGHSIDAMLAKKNPTVPYRHPRQTLVV